MKKYFKKTTVTILILSIMLGSALFIERNYFNPKINNDGNNFSDGNKLASVFTGIVKYIFLSDSDKEKVFLLIFQNNMELRPGGGFIGSFGIVKIKDKKIVEFAVHDTANFDGRIPDTVKPPYPMGEMLHIGSWKLRDANYSPDFLTNAKKAEEFYYAGDGREKFDGIIAVNASVLKPILKVLGPVRVDEMGEVNNDNIIISLEKQVEIDYKKQGIKEGDRKKIMNNLFGVIIEKMKEASFKEKIQLADIFMEELNKKEIQLYFKNESLQKSIENIGWAGEVNQSWKKDYLMLIDANMGAYKSDYYMKRDVNYFIDLSQKKPKVTMSVTYHHTAKQKDWMTNDYQSYLRVYVPKEAWISDEEEMKNTKIGEKFGKKYFGRKIFIPVGKSATIKFKYSLPENIANDYNFLFQKQSGIKSISLNMNIKYPDGTESKIIKNIEKDFRLKD